MKHIQHIAFLATILSITAFFACPAQATYEKSPLFKIEKMFLEGMYEKVINETDSLIDSRYGSKDELYYLKGLSELKLERFDDARKDFEHIVNKYAHSRNTFWAYVGIGDSYLLSGDMDKAVNAYSNILEKYPKDKNVGIVSERLAAARKKLGSQDVNDIGDKMFAHKAEPRSDNFITREPVPDREKDRISVQVGSFKKKDNADLLAQELHKKGYESYQEASGGADNRLYRVKIGKFRTKAEAMDMAYRLRRDGYRSKINVNE